MYEGSMNEYSIFKTWRSAHMDDALGDREEETGGKLVWKGGQGEATWGLVESIKDGDFILISMQKQQWKTMANQFSRN